MRYAIIVILMALGLVALFAPAFAASEWTGVFRDPERVVSNIAANPRGVALWLQSNISQAKCRDLEAAICPALTAAEKAQAARRARVEAERAGASAGTLAAIDAAVASADSAVAAEAVVGK